MVPSAHDVYCTTMWISILILYAAECKLSGNGGCHGHLHLVANIYMNYPCVTELFLHTIYNDCFVLPGSPVTLDGVSEVLHGVHMLTVHSNPLDVT